MSLKELAKQTGRNGDDQLVHMSRDEVNTLRGLAALSGTRLTTNPHTDLPEAFNLGGLFRKILPVVAGVAGTMIGGPAVGALASGATTAATTGSLEKGLMAGMGSYALGGLGNAALGQGAQNLATGAADAATQAGAEAAQQGMSTGIGEAAQQAMATQAGPGIGMAESLQSQFPSLTPDQITQVTAEGTPDLMAQRASMLNTFGQNTPTGQMGGTFQPTTMEKLGALNTNDIMKIGMENPAGVIGAGVGAMNLLTPEPETPGAGGPMIGAGLDPNYFRRLGQQQRGFASGGLASLNPKSDPGVNAGGSFGNNLFPQAGVQSPMYSEATQAPMERAVLRSGYEQMTNPSTGDQMFAEGGLASLAGGRAIRGPGDGMSDDVPAVIGGVEPARLADGEYVISADSVSHIGNGSTEAGVKKLDAMMARIRKARTGKPTIAPTIKAEKYLPA